MGNGASGGILGGRFGPSSSSMAGSATIISYSCISGCRGLCTESGMAQPTAGGAGSAENKFGAALRIVRIFAGHQQSQTGNAKAYEAAKGRSGIGATGNCGDQ